MPARWFATLLLALSFAAHGGDAPNPDNGNGPGANPDDNQHGWRRGAGMQSLFGPLLNAFGGNGGNGPNGPNGAAGGQMLIDMASRSAGAPVENPIELSKVSHLPLGCRPPVHHERSRRRRR